MKVLNIFAAGKGGGWRKERREEGEEAGKMERFVKLRRTFHFGCDCDARFAARVKSVAQTIDKLIDKLTKLPREEEREREWGMRGTGERGEREKESREGAHGVLPL